MFFICAAIYIIGMIAFLLIGSGEVQPWATRHPVEPVVVPEQTALTRKSILF